MFEQTASLIAFSRDVYDIISIILAIYMTKDKLSSYYM